MTIHSWGFSGTIAPGSVWAQMQWGLGRRYWVRDFASVRCSPVAAGTREVDVSAGFFGGWGITNHNDAPVRVQLPVVAAGTRYFMVCARRTWGATNATTFVAIESPVTGPPVPAALPARNMEPGVVDDQPLFLVPLTAGDTVPGNPIDLRALGTEGGTYRTFSDLALQYLDFEGARVDVNGRLWSRQADSAGAVIWRDMSVLIGSRHANAAITIPHNAWTRIPFDIAESAEIPWSANPAEFVIPSLSSLLQMNTAVAFAPNGTGLRGLRIMRGAAVIATQFFPASAASGGSAAALSRGFVGLANEGAYPMCFQNSGADLGLLVGSADRRCFVDLTRVAAR